MSINIEKYQNSEIKCDVGNVDEHEVQSMEITDSIEKTESMKTTELMGTLERTTNFMMKVFLNVLFNWTTIKQNEQIMNLLNMETNSMCRLFKNQNPTLHDVYIQANVFSLLLMLWFAMVIPTTLPIPMAISTPTTMETNQLDELDELSPSITQTELNDENEYMDTWIPMNPNHWDN